MSRPRVNVPPDDGIAPLDGSGSQAWSAQEGKAIEQMLADPEFWSGVARADADIAAGRVYSHEEVVAMSAERRRLARAERGL